MSKALKAAIEANDPEAVRKALIGIKDINRKIPGANKPLLYACEKGADKVLEVLFEAGAVAERGSTFPGDTPFAVAAQHEQQKVLQQLWKLKQASQQAVGFALDNAAMDGRIVAYKMLLETVKPEISIKMFNLAAASKNAVELIRLLVANGGNVHVRNEKGDEKGGTPLHLAASRGRPDVMAVLVECGADVNARDTKGQTPLLWLAGSLGWLGRDNCEELAKKALTTLLDLGADASAKDNFGNDAITHYEFECARDQRELTTAFGELLLRAGASGWGVTGKLFDALRADDATAVRRAISEGANVNHVNPRGGTPLMWASTDEILDLLLKAGADPNKQLPLISAARCGKISKVKKLIAAGADINAVEPHDDSPHNAYLAAVVARESEVADYLKSLGASKPKPVKTERLKPGVESWNDFSELLVKSTVAKAAEALARIINGKVQLDVYGQSLLPGKQAYVVARPKGMNWCNVFQIVPPRLRYEDSSKAEALARELAKVSGAPVLSIEYSDTSDAASVFRAEPDGKSSQDAGWDRDTLEEMVGAMGDEAPEWAKKQLAKSDEDELKFPQDGGQGAENLRKNSRHVHENQTDPKNLRP